LLKETDKLGCKPAKTPMKTNVRLDTEKGEPLKDINHFQRLVGKLIYLTITGLDLAFIISQFMHAPRTPHLEAINRILRYLKGSLGKGILMKRNKTNDICGYFRCRLGRKFRSKINNRFLYNCRRKFSHMEKQEVKCCGTIEHRSRISFHGIYR
jgi:hypothetical protein